MARQTGVPDINFNNLLNKNPTVPTVQSIDKHRNTPLQSTLIYDYATSSWKDRNGNIVTTYKTDDGKIYKKGTNSPAYQLVEKKQATGNNYDAVANGEIIYDGQKLNNWNEVNQAIKNKAAVGNATTEELAGKKEQDWSGKLDLSRLQALTKPQGQLAEGDVTKQRNEFQKDNPYRQLAQQSSAAPYGAGSGGVGSQGRVGTSGVANPFRPPYSSGNPFVR